MEKGRFWLIAAAFLLIQIWAGAEVQWLSYHTSERARDIVGGSSQFKRLEGQAPAEV